jgi:hypothetical protein
MPVTHGPGCGCRHEEDVEIFGSDLAPYVDAVEVYNAVDATPARRVVRPYAQRLEGDILLEAEDDGAGPEMMLVVTFTCPVKLLTFGVIGDESCSPQNVQLFANQPDLTMGDAEDVEPTQSFDLVEDMHGAVDYRVRVTKFAQVNSISFYFRSGLDELKLSWLGLRGESSNLQRRAVNTVYEARANLADHDVKEDTMGANQSGY